MSMTVRRLRQPTGFAALIALLALGGAGLGWWGYAERKAALAAERRVELKYRELRSLAKLTPALTEDMAEKIAGAVKQAEQLRTALQVELRGGDGAGGLMAAVRIPVTRTDAYFDLASFVEKMRERAHALDVALKEDERFGFAEYAHDGPEITLIPAVFRQRIVTECLVENLLESRPRQILSVQHESSNSLKDAGGQGMNYFVMTTQRSLRVPGWVETTAVRVSFTGHTSVLRTFLNRLAALRVPLVVRVVEAEPAAPMEDSPEARAPGGPGFTSAVAAVPLVASPLTKFTITVEYLELTSPTSNPPGA